MSRRDRLRRDDVAATARRRLELLSAELAELRAESGLPEDPEEDRDDLAGPHGEGEPPAPPGGLRRGGSDPWSAFPPRAGRWDVDESSDGPNPFTDRPESLTRVPRPGRHARRLLGGLWSGWVDDRVPATLRGRVALGGQHLAWLCGLVGVALALAGWLTLRGADEGEPVRVAQVRPPPSASDATAATPAPGVTPGAGSPAAPVTAAPSGSVVVDVAGKVRRPGVLTLPPGSRVFDAIKRAGGPRRGVDLSALNLARLLVDGEQILVGRAAAAAAAPGVAPSAAGSTPVEGALVNLNTATMADLETLPGVGPVTAQKILDWRTSNGSFTAVDELLEIDGIGDKTLAEIAPHVTL